MNETNTPQELAWNQYIKTCDPDCVVTQHTASIRSVLTRGFCSNVDVICVATYLNIKDEWDLMPIFITNEIHALDAYRIEELRRGVENLQHHTKLIAIYSTDKQNILTFSENVEQCIKLLKYW